MANLSDKLVRQCELRSKPYRLADTGAGSIRSMGIQVSPTGNKSWYVRYQIRGKTRFHKIGSFPITSLAQARKKAIEVLAVAEDGTDPARPVRPDAVPASFTELYEAYMRDAELRGIKSAYGVKRVMTQEILPVIGTMVAAEVGPENLREALVPMYKRGAKSRAEWTRRMLSAIFRFGAAAEYSLARTENLKFGITANPASVIPTISPSNPDDVYPSLGELAICWNNAYAYGRSSTALALQFHIAACGQRLQESTSIRWEQIIEVQGVECIHFPTSKVGRPHTIPIGSHMNMVLEQARIRYPDSEVCFPALDAERTPVSHSSVSNMYRRIRLAHDLGDFPAKSVRRAVKTILGDEGVTLEHRNLMQNHQQSATVAQKHYDRSQYIQQKIEVMEAWDRLLVAAGVRT